MTNTIDPRLIEKGLKLKNSDFFNRIDTQILLEIATLGEEIYIQKDEFLFKEGDPGDGLFFILNGSLDIIIGKKVVNTLNEGDVLGEIALIDSKPRTASVKALELTSLLRFSPSLFDEILEEYPAIAKRVIQTLINHIRTLTVSI
ncbi:MAG: cyclic nucleotide-binding domain-containing protein [Deltaproteobacteria bacterium]|jgi:CRP-like cAMP-binding protein|nr:cyclic nucleotide-binding domain-containing protein [Deltaproteobacteria bacterium]